jgi:hypothetical protein
MTGIGSLIEKFNETNELSRKWIGCLQKIGTSISQVVIMVANIRSASGVITNLVGTIARQNQIMRNLFFMKLPSSLPPIFEPVIVKTEKEFVPSHRSKFSVTWRPISLTGTASNLLGNLRKRAKDTRSSTILQPHLIYHSPLASKYPRIIAQLTHGISRAIPRPYEKLSAVTTMLSVSYTKKTSQARYLIGNANRKARNIFALADTALAFSRTATTNRNVLTIAKSGANAQPIDGSIAETHNDKVTVEVTSTTKAMSEKTLGLMTERIAKARRTKILDLPPSPVETIAKSTAKVSTVGLLGTLRKYSAAGRVGKIEILTNRSLRMNREMSAVLRERYLGTMASDSMPENLAMGPEFTDRSAVDKRIRLSRLVSRWSSREGLPLLTAEMVRQAASCVNITRKISQVFGALVPISKKTAISGLQTRKILLDSIWEKGLDGAVSDALGSAIIKPKYADSERLELERSPLGLFSVCRSAKLLEIAQTLRTSQTSVATSERQLAIKRTVNVNLTATTSEDENDLKNLERKIRKILEREARRYGVSA